MGTFEAPLAPGDMPALMGRVSMERQGLFLTGSHIKSISLDLETISNDWKMLYRLVREHSKGK